MHYIFFHSDVLVCQICLPKNQTITGAFTLTSVYQRWKSTKTINDQIPVLEDYDYRMITLDCMKVVELDHPPYIPDLAPSDFWVFHYLKVIPPEDYKIVMLVIQHGGECFEKIVP